MPDAKVGQPSIDQLRLFLAVVDEGSFHAAARRTARAISVVSYGVAALEAQLGVRLFDREGSRRPVLTDAGRALVASARAVADDVDALVARVRAMGQGLESELALAIDVMFPADRLAAVLRAFQMAFPTVDLRLNVEALGGVTARVLSGEAALGLGGPMLVEDPALDRQAIGDVTLIPVAAPGHALAQREAIAPGQARQFLQLVLTDRSPLTAGRDFSVLGSRTWRLADLGAKHALLREGIGWGNMPDHMVADDLASGRLVRLALPDSADVRFAFNLVWRRDCPAGPARQWIHAALATSLSEGAAASDQGDGSAMTSR